MSENEKEIEEEEETWSTEVAFGLGVIGFVVGLILGTLSTFGLIGLWRSLFFR